MNQTRSASQTRRKAVRRRSGVGTGTTSLLMIFTVLCFATLAMLSLSTAAANARIQGRGLESQRLLAAAKGAAAADVAGLDEVLYQLQREMPANGGQAAEDAYYEQALAAAAARGWQTDAGPGAISMRSAISEDSVLVTTLQLLPPGGARYQVLAQVSQLVSGWAPEQNGQLWMPE